MPTLPEQTYAVVVGVEQYKVGPSWDLTGPASDAHRFSKWLEQRGVPLKNIFIFVNQCNQTNQSTRLDWQGFQVATPTSSNIEDCLTKQLPTWGGGLLIFFWGGHGIITPGGERRLLFYADATDTLRRNLDFNHVRLLLRSISYAHNFQQQIYIIDACANYVLPATKDIPTTKLSRGARPLRQCEQYVLFATKPGGVAINIETNEAGLFSHELMQELAKLPTDQWPPNIDQIRKQVEERFEMLRAAKITRQVPVFAWVRDYLGNQEVDVLNARSKPRWQWLGIFFFLAMVSAVWALFALGYKWLVIEGMAQALTHRFSFREWNIFTFCLLLGIAAITLMYAQTRQLYPARTFSHKVMHGRYAPIRALVFLLLLTLPQGWGWYYVYPTYTFCTEIFKLNHLTPAIAILKEQNIDPFYMGVFTSVLSKIDQVHTTLLTTREASRCHGFLSHRLRLSYRADENIEQEAYSASFDDANIQPITRFRAYNKPDCGVFAELAYSVAESIGKLPPGIVPTSPPPPSRVLCDTLQLNNDGWTALEHDNYEVAEEKFRAAIDRERNFAVAYHNLGVRFHNQNEYHEAIVWYKQATELWAHPIFYNNWGLACRLLKDYECAKQQYTTAIDLDPGYLRAYNNLAVLYLDWHLAEQRPELLQAAASTLAQAEPMVPRLMDSDARVAFEFLLLKTQGRLEFQQQQYDQAITTLKRADQDQMIHRSVLDHFWKTNFEEEIVFYLGASYQLRGLNEDACQTWRRYKILPSGDLFGERERRDQSEQMQQGINCQ